jgi:hypothetical protein
MAGRPPKTVDESTYSGRFAARLRALYRDITENLGRQGLKGVRWVLLDRARRGRENPATGQVLADVAIPLVRPL